MCNIVCLINNDKKTQLISPEISPEISPDISYRFVRQSAHNHKRNSGYLGQFLSFRQQINE